MDKMERLIDDFNDLLNSDPDFNYSAGEFDKWLADLCNVQSQPEPKIRECRYEN